MRPGKLGLLPVLAVFMLLPPLALAQEQPAAEAKSSIDILPAKSLSEGTAFGFDESNQTHPPLRLTPDKSELIKLEKDAATIVVGNPAHLSILADSPTTLILVGRAPGATHFTVLDKDENVIMQRHVIVASPKEKYVRIRRSCASTDNKACLATQVYYCPDMCHEIAIDTGAETDDSSAAAGMKAAGETAAAGAEAAAPGVADTETPQ